MPSLVDLDAKHYQANSSIQHDLARELFSRYTFRGDEHVLDLGCGDGKPSKDLARLVPNGWVEGMDPSPSMIELAQKTFPTKEYPNLKFKLGKAEDLAEDKRYDIVTSFCAFHWFKEKRKTFSKMLQSLKPSGQMLIVTFPTESTYFQIFESVLKTPHWQAYMPLSACPNLMSAEEHKEIIRSFPCKPLYFNSALKTATFENIEHFKRYAKGWLPSFLPIPEKLQDSFLTEVGSYAKERFGKKGKPDFDVPYRILFFQVEKL